LQVQGIGRGDRRGSDPPVGGQADIAFTDGDRRDGGIQHHHARPCRGRIGDGIFCPELAAQQMGQLPAPGALQRGRAELDDFPDARGRFDREGIATGQQGLIG